MRPPREDEMGVEGPRPNLSRWRWLRVLLTVLALVIFNLVRIFDSVFSRPFLLRKTSDEFGAVSGCSAAQP